MMVPTLMYYNLTGNLFLERISKKQNELDSKNYEIIVYIQMQKPV